jgi:hypothetical protein
MIYRYTIDGAYYQGKDEVLGWEDITTTIKRDKGGILITQDVKLRFKGPAYKYVYETFFSSGFCTEIQVIIEESCDNGVTFYKAHEGIIKNSAIIINEKKCEAEATVTDNSFYARINNNRSIETTFAGRTKNDFTLSPPPINRLQMFNPVDGTNATSIPAYRIEDVLRYLVSFMSDNEVDFQSDHFSTGTYKNLCITNGYAIRNAAFATDHLVTVEFGKTFDELHKKLNLSFNIETGGSKPLFRLENKAFFYSNLAVASFTDVDEVKIKVKSEEIFSQINPGSETTNDGPALQFPEEISFEGFKNEKFFLLGQCNDLDNVLDLLSSYIISSNVIEDVLAGTNDSFDDDLFLIICEEAEISPNTLQPTKSNWLVAAPPYYYNELLRNKAAIENYLGFIPNSISAYFGTASNQFKAIKVSDEALSIFPPTLFHVVPVSFQNDSTAGGFDDGGNYDSAVTFEYTCVLGGLFSFHSLVNILAHGYFHAQLNIVRYDSGGVGGGVVLNTATTGFQTFSVNGTYTLDLSTIFTCTAGDKIVVTLDYTVVFGTVFKLLAGSYFECPQAVIGSGGVVATSDPNDYKIIQMEFEYPIDAQIFRYMKANPTGKFTVTSRGKTRRGWIDNIQYKHKSTKAKIQLLTSINV